jgi:hypothetical protein
VPPLFLFLFLLGGFLLSGFLLSGFFLRRFFLLRHVFSPFFLPARAPFSGDAFAGSKTPLPIIAPVDNGGNV